VNFLPYGSKLKPRVAAGEIRVWEKVVSLTRERAEAKSFGRSPIAAIYSIARHRARSAKGGKRYRPQPENCHAGPKARL